MKTPVTSRSIREHLAYAWWKYALVIVLAATGWNLIYTMTAYRPPAEKKVDMYICGFGEQEALDAYMEQVRVNEMSDMEEMSCLFLTVDDTYTPMQLMTYIAAGEGDIYLLPKDYFQSYAAEGGFLPLEDDPGVMEAAEAAGISLDKGWRTSSETGEKHLYGIPASELPGFGAYLYNTEDTYLSILVNNGNDENSLKFLSILLRDMAVAPAAEEDAEPAAE